MAGSDHDGMASRLAASAASAAIQLGIAAVLIWGLAARAPTFERAPAITAVLPSSNTPERPGPPPPAGSKPHGRAAPPAPRAKPLPKAAPLPPVVIATPQPAAAVAGSGEQSSAGAAVAGSGTGAGGMGTGLGAGGTADGSGAGEGLGRGPRRLSGRFSERDYPTAASLGVPAGSAELRFRVRIDGRTDNCRVLRSSGSAQLDYYLCRIVERRFRWLPARDSSGEAVASDLSTTINWEPRQHY